jgi:hypothetical protein
MFRARGCDGGFRTACTELGAQYDNGTGVRQDAALAAHDYQRACDLGDAAGCANFGSLLFAGRGTAKDQARGAQLIRNACLTSRVDWACSEMKRLGL